MSSPAIQFRSRVPRLAGAAVERARLTVVPRRRVRAARVPFVSLVSLVLLGGVIGLLLFNTSMQQAAFAATSLESQAGTLSAREQTLRMELEVLRDPQHVAERAQALGMVPPASPAFLRLPDGKVLGKPMVSTRLDGVRLRPKPPTRPAILDPRPVHVDAPAGSGASTAADGLRDGRNESQQQLQPQKSHRHHR
jgi:cell division protein FtsB